MDGVNIINQAKHSRGRLQHHCYHPVRNGYRLVDRPLNRSESLGPCLGSEKLQKIFMESTPELNSSLFLQILNNQVSKASKPKLLEFRFCNLEVHFPIFLLEQKFLL